MVAIQMKGTTGWLCWVNTTVLVRTWQLVQLEHGTGGTVLLTQYGDYLQEVVLSLRLLINLEH